MTCLCAFVSMERCGIAAERGRTCLPSELSKETKNSTSNQIRNSQHSVFRIQVILGDFEKVRARAACVTLRFLSRHESKQQKKNTLLLISRFIPSVYTKHVCSFTVSL